MSSVLGIDFSSKALDLVLLDENSDVSRWDRLPLPECFSKVELARAVADAMPGPSWFQHHEVYLVACEEPMGQNRQAIAALYTVLGALVTSMPRELPIWLLRPAEWKAGVGLPGNLKTSKGDGQSQLRSWAVAHGASVEWPVDACVALALAYTAREQNAAAIAKALEAA
jgi:hypothetical protein